MSNLDKNKEIGYPQFMSEGEPNVNVGENKYDILKKQEEDFEPESGFQYWRENEKYLYVMQFVQEGTEFIALILSTNILQEQKNELINKVQDKIRSVENELHRDENF